MARIVSLTVLTTLIVFLGITFFQVIAPFLLPLFLAGVLAVLCQPVYRYFLRRANNRQRLAAGLTTMAVLAAFLIPILVGTFIASVQLFTLAQTTLGGHQWKQNVKAIRETLDIDHLVEGLLPYVSNKTDPDRLQAEMEANLQAALKALSQRTLGLAGAAAGAAPGVALGLFGSLISGLVSSLMFVIALYYFLADGPALLSTTQGLIPVHTEYQQELLARFDKVVRAVVLATFMAAICQGVTTALALQVFGFGHFFIFSIVATFASLIPLAGTWLVWGPCAFWLAYQGHPIQATVLTLFGLTVIGMMDNVIRTYVLNSDAKLHPLLAFVSVLGGLQVMGLWGIFIGPIVASCLHALIQIFNMELKEFSKSKISLSNEQRAIEQAESGNIDSMSEASDALSESGQADDAKTDGEPESEPTTTEQLGRPKTSPQ